MVYDNIPHVYYVGYIKPKTCSNLTVLRRQDILRMKWLVLGILLAVLSTTQGRNPEDGKVVAAHTTRTAIVLTTSTTVRPFTCALATNPEVCQKRRFRRYSAIADQLLENDGPSLDGSLLGLVDQDSESSARKPRIALNIIFTTSSTYTVTATSTNRAITFSLSFFCTVNGASYPPACG
ncbi:uncharacterized protein LOC121864871 isoform X2 [Homarus americanus]|uniref:uncharacterized protein LOC121864871 isoform X2 n=1 Tax=Homarus americanus TaxID=6706 RepID=UPI001C4445D9|nr:uncharacterized protein LOC121864871 isoform X2 [Homarus americanus]